jgi:predicted DNA-binding transcriptional regulator YafY
VADKTERLFNLIALLLNTSRPLAPDEIRRKIPGYEGSDVAFRRMFERDKEELRELGLPLELVGTDAWEAEEGYRIRQERATLPDLDLTADERAALSLAAQAWQGQAVPGDPERALMKLTLASKGAGPDPKEEAFVRASVDASQPSLAPLFDAIARRKRVTFRYRGRSGGDVQERTVDPYALRHRGAWYLAGLDHLRNEVRHFKLDRFAGKVEVADGRDPDFEVPVDVEAEVPRGPWAIESSEEARVAFAPETAWWVERRTGARRGSERPDGWVEMTFPLSDREMFSSWILSFAADAVVVAPDDLRELVVARLQRAAGR